MNFKAIVVAVFASLLVCPSCKDLPSPEPFRPYEEIPISADEQGYIEGSANAAGIQGQWYSYAGLDSTITPVPLNPFRVENGKICTSGETPAVTNNDFSSYYGAGIGFYLCYSDDEDNPPEFPYTLSECPLSPLAPEMHTKIAGIAFHLETKIEKHPEIRVVFREWRREESPYVGVRVTGEYQALFKEGRFGYPAADPSGSHPAEIHSILFQVAGAETLDQDFDFCLSDLRVLVNPIEETDTSPFEGTNTNSLDAGENCTPDHYLDAGLEWVTVGDPDDPSAFKMLRTEVTAGQYLQCKDASCCKNTGNWEICSVDGMQYSVPEDPAPRDLQQPANCVDWYQARAFCRWAGGDLPTKMQWEAATQGGDEEALYPWGTEMPTCEWTVMNDNSGEGCDGGILTPLNVCSISNGNTRDGLCDMAGNVWEWLDDWYPQTKTIQEETFRMMKGGSYFSREEALKIKTSGMEHPAFPRDIGKIGFRCVKD